MRRTRLRPLPDGRITPRDALLFSAAIAVIGTLYLGLMVNWLTALLGAFTLTSYIFVYTPLKRISTACTIIGAMPGAIPPLMGWTAATGSLAVGGWILFGILFFWQLPHFMAISWIYREDYGRAGFVMTSVRDERRPRHRAPGRDLGARAFRRERPSAIRHRVPDRRRDRVTRHARDVGPLLLRPLQQERR
jgi:protoheme IX farnesyltransferase